MRRLIGVLNTLLRRRAPALAANRDPVERPAQWALGLLLAPDTAATAAVSGAPPVGKPAGSPPSSDATREAVEAFRASGNDAAARAAFATLEAADGDAWYAETGFQLFRGTGKHDRILHFATTIRHATPGRADAHIAACTALRALSRAPEAETAAQNALLACPEDHTVWQEAALVAQANKASDVAQRRWSKVRALRPDLPDGYVGAVRLAAPARLDDPARAVLDEGLARFPRDFDLLVAAARQAARDERWDTAASHWDAATGLRPDDPDLALEAALSFLGPPHDRSKRAADILIRVHAIQERFADFVGAGTARVDMLRTVGRLDEAAACGREMSSRFPKDQALALACAHVAEVRGAPDEAVSILRSARPDDGSDSRLEVAYIRALGMAGDDRLAEEVCAAALDRFGQNVPLIEQHLKLASQFGDRAELTRRCDRWTARYPENAAIKRSARRLLDHYTPVSLDRPAAGDRPDTLAEMFGRFESLGASSGGCEFGTVQRRFGAEPISLLRWGNMQMAGITRALQARFAGMGEAEHTTIKIEPVPGNQFEYFITDRRYNYYAHTFIKTDEAPQARVYQQTLRRMVFLRNKLIEDLEQADKIFVFKIVEFKGLDEIGRMFAAMRTYGPCTLVCVTVADADHPAGTVRMLEPGLFLGRVKHFRSGMDDLDSWRLVCEAVALWQDTERAVSLREEGGTARKEGLLS